MSYCDNKGELVFPSADEADRAVGVLSHVLDTLGDRAEVVVGGEPKLMVTPELVVGLRKAMIKSGSGTVDSEAAEDAIASLETLLPDGFSTTGADEDVSYRPPTRARAVGDASEKTEADTLGIVLIVKTDRDAAQLRSAVEATGVAAEWFDDPRQALEALRRAAILKLRDYQDVPDNCDPVPLKWRDTAEAAIAKGGFVLRLTANGPKKFSEFWSAFFAAGKTRT